MDHAPERTSYDVAVVGAGIVGLSCAWAAEQRGLSVLVVDRAAPGSGASGVAAGMLAPVTEAVFGEEALLRLNLEAARRWPAFAARLAEASGLDTSYSESGALMVAADRDDFEELRRIHDFQRAHGLDAEWLPGSRCRELEPGLSPRVRGGIAARDHSVDPRAIVQALSAVCPEALLADAHGIGIQDGRVVGLQLATGTVACRNVVVAAGAWSGSFGVSDVPPVRPVKGQILRLHGSPPSEGIVRTPRCYVVPRANGEVVIGATVEEQGFDTRVTAEGVYRLLEAAWEVLPDVGELELVEARAGLRPGTPDNGPVVGRGSVDGLIWATGHYRSGILQAPITADAVAALLCGEEPPDELVPFAPGRFALAGRPA
ncbi:MAG: glycine oxidase ThiO [Thermoleophilaceae bacterium]